VVRRVERNVDGERGGDHGELLDRTVAFLQVGVHDQRDEAVGRRRTQPRGERHHHAGALVGGVPRHHAVQLGPAEVGKPG
jgi:hypothetical protein